MPKPSTLSLLVWAVILVTASSLRGQTTLTVNNNSGAGHIADFEAGSTSPVAEVDYVGDILTGGFFGGLSSATNTNVTGGLGTASNNGGVGGNTLQGSDNSSSSGSLAAAGYAIVRGGELTAGTPNPSAVEGVVQLGAGYLKGTIAAVGDVVCSTAVAFTVTDCSHTGTGVNIVGIATSILNPIGVVSNGTVVVQLDGGVTNVGDIVCMGTMTDGRAHDNLNLPCPNPQSLIGSVIADSGSIIQMAGNGTATISMSPTSPALVLVQLSIGGGGPGTIPISMGGTNATSAVAGTVPNATSGTASSWTPTVTLGASGTLGSITMGNATSSGGTLTLEPTTGSLGTVTQYIPVPPSSPGTLTQTIAAGTAALPNASGISSGTCTAVGATTITTSFGTVSNVMSTDNLMADFNADPTGITGYKPGPSGMLTIIKFPTSSSPYVNFRVCNNTASSIVPGAVTLNWRVVR